MDGVVDSLVAVFGGGSAPGRWDVGFGAALNDPSVAISCCGMLDPSCSERAEGSIHVVRAG